MPIDELEFNDEGFGLDGSPPEDQDINVFGEERKKEAKHGQYFFSKKRTPFYLRRETARRLEGLKGDMPDDDFFAMMCDLFEVMLRCQGALIAAHDNFEAIMLRAFTKGDDPEVQRKFREAFGIKEDE